MFGAPLPRTTTHDWRAAVDTAHLDDVRSRAVELAPGGLRHLVAEALAYPAEEAASLGAGRCQVTLAADGSILVSDAGRGTHTVVDDAGRVIRKPVMATRDVRFFSERRPPRLPDGQPRRGMSVVAALSSWLVHTNRCADGAWSQRYEYGVPVTDLQPVVADGSTGTSVRFFADPVLVPQRDVPAELVRQWATEWSALELSVHDDRPGMVRS